MQTKKEMILELLGRLDPGLDLSDEEAVFGRILDDYEQYAGLINSYRDDLEKAERDAEVRGRNAAIDEEAVPGFPTDGIPALGGANNPYRPLPRTSIFDIALGA